MFKRSLGMFEGGPDVSHAAKSGAPTMTDPKRTFPASIPVVANADNGTGTAGTGTAEVTASTVGPNSALDKNPDARTTATGTTAPTPAAQPSANQPLPTNRDAELKKYRERQAKKQEKLAKKKKKKDENTDQTPQPATAQPGSAQPAPSSPAQPATNPANSPQQ